MKAGLVRLADVVNAYNLDPKLLLAALVAATRARPLRTPMIEDETALILDVVEKSDIPEAEKVTAAVAINLRLKALAHMLGEHPLITTCLAGAGREPNLYSQLLIYTVSEPVLDRSDHWVFDCTRFVDRLLMILEPKGSA